MKVETQSAIFSCKRSASSDKRQNVESDMDFKSCLSSAKVANINSIEPLEASQVQNNGTGNQETSQMKASSLLSAHPLFRNNYDNYITLDDIQAEINDAKETFRSGFEKLLPGADIDMSRPIKLESGFDGIVYVSNDHPDKEKIDGLLKQNPDLMNEFRRASACSSMLAHAKEASAFQKAYAIDPKAAVAQFSYLFNQDYKDVFSMLIEKGEDSHIKISSSFEIFRNLKSA